MDEKLYPLMCRIFGHKFVSQDDITKNSNEVVCVRCAERTILPVKTICKMTGHNWYFGKCQRCGEKKSELYCNHHYHVVSVFHKNTDSNLPVTFRQYKCCHCGNVKGDDAFSPLSGYWVVDKEGSLVPA